MQRANAGLTIPSDKYIIATGVAAWAKLKKSRTFEDWLAVGRALPVGLRIAMAKAGVSKPTGGKFTKYFSWWMRDAGFGDMPHSARHCAMAIAENEKGVVALRAKLPPTSRPHVYPANTWNAYRTAVLKRPTKASGDKRLRVDEATAILAREAARLAAKDAAKGQYVSANAVEMIADACLIAILNTFDVVVPPALARPYTNGTGKRAPPKNGTGVAARG